MSSESKTIKKFHGISQNDSVAVVPPDYALDLLNVLPGATGLEKLRLPVALSPVISGLNFGPIRFYDFQQSSNPITKTTTRQVIGFFGTQIYLFSGDNLATIPVLIDDNPLNDAQWDLVTSNNIMFGANGKRMIKYLGDSVIRAWQPSRPAAAPILNGTRAPIGVEVGLTFLNGGRKYKYAWKSSLDSSQTSMSDATASTGNLANLIQFVDIDPTQAPTGFDICVLYATLDGGGDFFYHSEAVVAAYAHYSDAKQDAAIDTTTRGSIYNEPPPVGQYLAKWQGRIFIFCLQGARQDVAYSGQELIAGNVGRPETSFPPNNRLRLSVGADEIRGGGVMDQGVVAFSKSSDMYMWRGQVEDVSSNAPLNFSLILRHLPWQMGAASHYSIQSTPQGLQWLAADRTVKLFNGITSPISVSNRLRPILQQATDAILPYCQSAYWNYLDRNWYVLACGVGVGPGTFNRLFIFDMTRDPETNAGIFISDIECESIGIVENSQGHRRLMIGKGGRILQLLVESDTVSGISTLPTRTAGRLPAFYRGGYFGNDKPQQRKLFRGVKQVVDGDGFQGTAQLVNDRDHTFTTPEVIENLKPSEDQWYSINRKGIRMSWTVIFPTQDVSANLVELTCQFNFSGER